VREGGWSRIFRFLFFIAALFCLTNSLPAHAAVSKEPSANNAIVPPACGLSVKDALKAARAALAANSPDQDRTALSCLIAAVAALETARLDAVREIDHAHVLAVPQYPASGP
jgi:hypothetical protein